MCFYEQSSAYFAVVLFVFIHPPRSGLIAPYVWILPLPLPAVCTMAFNPETAVEMEFGILSMSQIHWLSHSVIIKLVPDLRLCFGLLPPEPQVVILQLLFPIFFQKYQSRGAPSQSLASKCGTGSVPLDFTERFQTLPPSLFWPLAASISVLFLFHEITIMEPDKCFVFQFPYLIAVDVEQKGEVKVRTYHTILILYFMFYDKHLNMFCFKNFGAFILAIHSLS